MAMSSGTTHGGACMFYHNFHLRLRHKKGLASPDLESVLFLHGGRSCAGRARSSVVPAGKLLRPEAEVRCSHEGGTSDPRTDIFLQRLYTFRLNEVLFLPVLETYLSDMNKYLSHVSFYDPFPLQRTFCDDNTSSIESHNLRHAY